jgi:hypothetical protein
MRILGASSIAAFSISIPADRLSIRFFISRRRFMPRNEDDQKFQIEAVTSDITYMKETYCIAGWNPSGQHMKRLFIKGKHWEDGDLKKIGKYARLLVNVIPAERSRDFPHQTEDTWIDSDFKVMQTYDAPKKLVKDLHLSASLTIQRAFDRNMIYGSRANIYPIS